MMAITRAATGPMPCRKILWAAALCLAGMLPLAARADTRNLLGSSLSLTLTNGEDTIIETDPALTKGIRLVADNVDCLEASGQGGGGEIQLSTAPCGSSAGQLTLMLPADFPLTLMLAGSGNVRAGSLQGPLKATLASDGDLNIQHANTLQLTIRGSGDATVQHLTGSAEIDVAGSGTVKLLNMEGPLKYQQHGSGDLAIANISSPAVQIASAGSGDVVIAGGHIGALQVHVYGSGDFAMSGTLDTADLLAAGGGDIRIPQPTGTLQRRAIGGSSISVGAGGGIASSAMQRLSQSLASDDDDDGDSAAHASSSHDGGNGFHHFLAGLVVLGLLAALWRTLARNGGAAALGRRFAPQGGAPAAPRDPGVIALCELMSSLERRLARVEIHVTSKEFDLNRKFREIDAGR